ncbi:MAG: hypothetical protein WEB63_07235 [Cucumibacter sp.]
MSPLVSHVGAVAYALHPALRRLLPTDRIEAMTDIDEFWAAIQQVAPELEAPLRAHPRILFYLADDARDRSRD